MFDLIFILIGGAILGWLGKKLARDDIRIPTWLTVVCGIGGMLVGNFLYGLFFADNTPGFDWWRHTWQVVVAAVLVTFASRYRTGSRSRVRV
jgi:uncharacterized membrane protein YeaQ/YmgE (transglycosylase-associated protein family)